MNAELVLSALVSSDKSAKGLAHAITGDTTSEARQAAEHEAEDLVSRGLCRRFVAGGVLFYQRCDLAYCRGDWPENKSA